MSSSNLNNKQQQQPSSGPASSHDLNLVDVLFSSALDGEFVRDQIAGTYKKYDHASDSQTADSFEANKAMFPIDSAHLLKLRSGEIQAIRTAESGDLQAGIDQLSQVISDCPHYASAYNNRAQAYRLQNNDAQALADLDQAIRYAQDRTTLGQAFTQKAIILRAQGDQDAAYYNFSQGAKCGNEVAQMAAPKENPYAKLCGRMVAEAMRQLVVPGNK
ncbi:hypothetical protein GGI15_000559 [Coemansia interrupta]|uniref:Tetratricopeptide repeat protein 36 n=1 Tax=Coemansia interrupta TaxID=1126814 RepID=A0A9W8HN14_9FUNG|nr:hypothetical protein GGI15_000559 [Coemansia interrupta]